MTQAETGNSDRSPPDDQTAPEGGPPPLFVKVATIIGRLFLAGFALFWLGGVSTMLFFVGRELWQELRKALAYKPVPAHVTKVIPAAKTDDDEETSASFEYAYTVAGTRYKGTWGLSDRTCPPNEYERRIPPCPAVGDGLTAYFDPDEPVRSTLVPIAQPFLLGFLIFISPFAATGVAMLYAALVGSPRKLIFRGGRHGRPTVSGGGPYVASYFILSAVTAFAFFGASFALPWKAAWYLGVALWLIVVPLLTWRIGGWFRRRAERGGQPAEPARRPSQPARRRPAKVMAGLLAITLFWCGITGVFVAIVIGSIAKQLDAKARFRAAQGVVVSSGVKRHPGDSDSGPTYEPIIKYRYTVAGKTYQAKRYVYGFGSTSERGGVQDIVRRFPKGKRVTVYYDPDDPAEAVLALEVQGLHWFLLLFLQPFMLVGLGLIGFTATYPARNRRVQHFLESRMQVPCRIPTWGELKQEMGGATIQARRGALGLLAALAGGYGLTCFLAIFVLAFLFGGPDASDSRTVRIVLAIAAGVGVLAALLALVRPARKARLHIDAALGHLVLTSPKRDVRLQLDQIVAWFVRGIPNPHKVKSDSDLPQAPMLAMRTADGQVVPIHVFRANPDGRAIADKAAEGFAELTGKPLAKDAPPDAEEDQAPLPASPLEIVGAVAKAAKAGREYADLT